MSASLATIQPMINQALLVVIDAMGFLSLACLAWAVFPQPALELPGFIGGQDDPALGPGGRPRRRRALKRLVARLGRAITRGEIMGELAKPRLIYTGSQMTVLEFNGVRVLCGLFGAFAGLVLLRDFKQLPPSLVIIAVAVGLLAPSLWLKAKVAARQKAILRLLPEMVDLLSLCIGAGLDFLMALNKVVSLKKIQKEPLIEELAVALQEIKFGKRRMEALKAMAKRVNLPEISSFVRTVTQADRMGTPVGEVLAMHSEDVRGGRLMRAEREALKAPIKILVPLIFFIMPCVAIVVGAPIFIQFMTQSPFGKQ